MITPWNFPVSVLAIKLGPALLAEQLKPVTLELGGKSAALVLDDVDVDVFRANLFRASLRNSGQTCYAATRLLLSRSRYAELVENRPCSSMLVLACA